MFGYSPYSSTPKRPTDPQKLQEYLRKLNIKLRLALTDPSKSARARVDEAIRILG